MKLLDIATRPQKNVAMQTCSEQMITVESGLANDFRRPPSKRQVTVLSSIQWQKACLELGVELPWTARRANLLIDGLEFNASIRGKTIYLGNVELLVCGETDPCHKMDRYHQGLKLALMPDWRGGVCCTVITGGQLQIGDELIIN